MEITQSEQQGHYTYADYLQWPGERRYELIDGVAYVKEPPAPSPLHQGVVGELYHQLRTALGQGPCRVYIAPFDVRLPKSGDIDAKAETVVQPDLLIVGDVRRIDSRGLRGPPDWLAEILSPSTAAHDQVVKLPRYESAGVPEVWLVSPADRTVAMYRLENGRYGRPVIQELTGRSSLCAVPGVCVDWDPLVSGSTLAD
ncbi:MAG TPA: Uma2 family endonuclease [Steroidobacteraceae bacterium]|jgi:Uma2 family endonuclease